MKTPPLLLGCALAFWGWQADLLWVGVGLGLLIESPQAVKIRWEISDDDFKRIWSFCLLALLAVLLYIFNENSGPAALGDLADAPASHRAQRAIGTASNVSAVTGIKWAPMIFYLFVLAQVYSTREKILLATVSPFFWRRRAAARKTGANFAEGRQFNPTYPCFGLCLLAASFHPNEAHDYFWGFALLVGWALWPHRSRRYGILASAIVLALAVGLGFGGQRGLMNFQGWFGRLNAAWIAEIMARRATDPTRATTAIGVIGRLAQSGRIVIRLGTPPGAPPPPLLREASYTTYRREAWLMPRGLVFGEVTEQASLTEWDLLPHKKPSASVTIASFLKRRRDLLPLPTGTARLQNLEVETVHTNALGAVRATGPGLVIFDALYAPGATSDSPPNADTDWAIPREETNAVAQVAAGLKLTGASVAEKLAAVQRYFADNYTYSVWQEAPRQAGGTPMSRFLLETHQGHCEFFATATVLLLRQLDIPARYAVGYAVHEEAGANKYVVRQRDGHAWCLAWNAEKQIWEDFDTTPGTFIAVEARRASGFQFLSDAWSRAWFEFSKFRWGQSQWRQYLLWGLLPVLGLLLFQIFRQARRRNTRKSAGETLRREWPGLDSEFYQLAEELAAASGGRRAEETWSHWLARAAADPQLGGVKREWQEVLELHYRHRFDPAGLSRVERHRLRQLAQQCRAELAGRRAGLVSRPAN